METPEKINNGNTKTMCEVCSKITIKTPERRQKHSSGAFMVTLKCIYTLFWCFPR